MTAVIGFVVVSVCLFAFLKLMVETKMCHLVTFKCKFSSVYFCWFFNWVPFLIDGKVSVGLFG